MGYEKNVLVCGFDGYLGHALTLRLLEKGYNVAGIDNYVRREWVREMGSFSATPIDDPMDRLMVYKSMGNFLLHNYDMCDEASHINDILERFRPNTIVNLAQQPSAPYSHKDRDHALYSVWNNVAGTMNILFGMKEYCPNAHLIQIGSMGEYDHSMGTPIEEGTFDYHPQENTSIAKSVIFPRRPGSFYHASKVSATYMIDCACRWWGLRATDIMQGVVYGNWTPEIQKTMSHTRLDSDEAFGTVVNRFIVQAILDLPLTVYGKGEHSRGFLAINDSIQCLMLAIENIPEEGEYRTWNQLDKTYTMNEVSQIVKDVGKARGMNVEIENIPSPRAEKTDHFDYRVKTDKLKALGFEPTRTMEEEVEWVINNLILYKDELFPLENVVIPQIKWR